jgi:hypothetical protein
MSLTYRTDLKKALRSLKNQHISVEEVHGPPDGVGFFLSPIGIALTVPQVLKLKADGELDSQGTKNFASKEKNLVERDVESTTDRIPPGQLCSWTAAKISAYINEEFDRVHSIRQVTATLNRLNIEYKRV